MTNVFQRLFGRHPSFIDDILDGTDHGRAKEFYNKWHGQEYHMVEIDTSAVSWRKDIDCSLLYFYAKPGREKQDWIVAVDGEDEMSYFVFNETDRKVAYVTKGFLGREASAIFSTEYAKLTGVNATFDLSGDDRIVIADNFAIFLDEIENADINRRSD